MIDHYKRKRWERMNFDLANIAVTIVSLKAGTRFVRTKIANNPKERISEEMWHIYISSFYDKTALQLS